MTFRGIIAMIVCSISAILIIYGAWLIFPAISFIIAGVLLPVIAYLALGSPR